MQLIISLCAAAGFIAVFRKPLKSYSSIFYIAAILISTASAILGLAEIGGAVGAAADFFNTGFPAAALWCMIMWSGALFNGSKPMKAVMPVRGELAIFTSLLTLGHIARYAVYYATIVINGTLSARAAAELIVSLAMLMIMLPLTVISLKPIRKKLPPDRWKRWQRTAYLFSALLCLHTSLILIPRARSGSRDAYLGAVVWIAVFALYAAARIAKFLTKRSPEKRRSIYAIGVCSALIVILAFGIAFHPESNAISDAEDIEKADESSAALTDGSYSGTARGYDGDITVTVEISGGRIVTITADSTERDRWYFGQASDRLIPEIIEKQSTDVDAVSVATYSSEGIIGAVRAALGKAGA